MTKKTIDSKKVIKWIVAIAFLYLFFVTCVVCYTDKELAYLWPCAVSFITYSYTISPLSDSEHKLRKIIVVAIATIFTITEVILWGSTSLVTTIGGFIALMCIAMIGLQFICAAHIAYIVLIICLVAIIGIAIGIGGGDFWLWW